MKKLKITLISILIFIVLTATVLLSLGSNYLYNLALNPKTPKDLIFNSDHNKSTDSINKNDQIWLLEQSNYEDLFLTSKDGLKLHNYVLSNLKSNKWVITVHGYTSQGIKMAPYARNFYEMGYNVIIPDLRGHGQSEGDYIGMGWDERLDIIDLIHHIIENDKNAEIVLFGVSMGGATVMNVSGEALPSNVKAIIEDCGYTSVWNEFSYQLKALFGLPAFPMLHTTSLLSKCRAGYWLGEASTIDQVRKSITPMLFIHGDQDGFVPSFMINDLYEAAHTPKEKLIIEGAAHAESREVNPNLYWSTITNFLNKYAN